MLDTATQNSSGIVDTLVKIGSLLGSIAFIYTLRLNARNAPKFDFDFGSFSGINKMPSSDGKVHFSCTFKGFIVNKSNENNYIKKIYLVVWKNRKKRDSTLRFGYGNHEISDRETKRELLLPLSFRPKEAKHIEITFRQQATGTCDENLIKEPRPKGWVVNNDIISRFIFWIKQERKAYRSGYEIVFEDTKGNMFDQKGRMIDVRITNLNWTLSNYKGHKKAWQYIKIYFFKFTFFIKKLFLKLGFY